MIIGKLYYVKRWKVMAPLLYLGTGPDRLGRVDRSYRFLFHNGNIETLSRAHFEENDFERAEDRKDWEQ